MHEVLPLLYAHLRSVRKKATNNPGWLQTEATGTGIQRKHQMQPSWSYFQTLTCVTQFWRCQYMFNSSSNTSSSEARPLNTLPGNTVIALLVMSLQAFVMQYRSTRFSIVQTARRERSDHWIHHSETMWSRCQPTTCQQHDQLNKSSDWYHQQQTLPSACWARQKLHSTMSQSGFQPASLENKHHWLIELTGQMTNSRIRLPSPLKAPLGMVVSVFEFKTLPATSIK